MTNRQSNIIFYSVIATIVCALTIHFMNPNFFSDLSKNQEEVLIEEAIKDGEHNKALTLYHTLVDKQLKKGHENTVETATMYEEMANLYLLLGNKQQEKDYYLKALNVKEKLDKVSISSLTNTYSKLGALAEAEQQYDQAQSYYEKSLAHKLGTATSKEDRGLVLGYQNDREQYLRLNNESTITTLAKLGEIHALKQETAIAKEYYERALAASKLTFGEDDSRTSAMASRVQQFTQ